MKNSITNCIRESELDTIEISMRKKMEKLISEGNIKEAEILEDNINKLDYVPVCNEESTQGFSMMMRDRARYV